MIWPNESEKEIHINDINMKYYVEKIVCRGTLLKLNETLTVIWPNESEKEIHINDVNKGFGEYKSKNRTLQININFKNLKENSTKN